MGCDDHSQKCQAWDAIQDQNTEVHDIYFFDPYYYELPLLKECDISQNVVSLSELRENQNQRTKLGNEC